MSREEETQRANGQWIMFHPFCLRRQKRVLRLKMRGREGKEIEEEGRGIGQGRRVQIGRRLLISSIFLLSFAVSLSQMSSFLFSNRFPYFFSLKFSLSPLLPNSCFSDLCPFFFYLLFKFIHLYPFVLSRFPVLFLIFSSSMNFPRVLCSSLLTMQADR